MVNFFKKSRKLPSDWVSSVAKGGGGAIVSTIGLLTKVQKKKNTTYFSSSETAFFLRWNELKSDLKHFLKHIFRRGGGKFVKN